MSRRRAPRHRRRTLATYNHTLVRNVEVNVIDNNAPDLVITETGGKTQVLEGSLVPFPDGTTQGIADTFTVGLTKAPSGPTTFQLSYDHTRLQTFIGGVATTRSPSIRPTGSTACW